jgi:hypothetical protein
MILILLASLLFPVLAQAQELLLAQTTPPRLEWSYQTAPGCTVPAPTVDVQASQTFGGTYTRVAELPIPATTYTLPTTANNLYYRISNPCGNSNVVQYVQATPPPTGPTIEDRLTTLETSVAALRLADQSLASRVTALESPIPPPSASTFTITHIDATHIRIVCNGIGITTSGSGTSRTMECRQ